MAKKDIAAKIFGLVLLLIAALCFSVQLPGVQKRIAARALSSLQKKIQGNVQVGDLVVESANSFILKDVLVLDDGPERHADTIFYARSIAGSISGKSLFSNGGVHLSRLEINDAYAHFDQEPDRILRNNFSRVISARKRAEKAEKAKTLGQPILQDAADTLLAMGGNDAFLADKVIIRGLHYVMHDPVKPKNMRGERAINYSDLEAWADLTAHDVKVRDGYFIAAVDEAVLKEKCGYEVKHISGNVKVGHGKAIVEKIIFEDPWSKLTASHYSMTSLCDTAYRNYTHMVRMKAVLDKGKLSSKTVSAFALGIMPKSDFLLDVKGVDMEGYCNDFKVNKLKATELNSGTGLDLRGSVTGLTDTKNILFNLRLNSIDFTAKGAGKLIGRLNTSKKAPDFSKYAPGTKFNFKGSAKGPLNRLHANGRLSSGAGKASADLDLRNLTDKQRPSQISGTISTHELDAGKIIGNDKLGEFTLNTGFRATLDGSSKSVVVDSFYVDKLGLLGYNYTGIAAAGRYADDSFDGKIICADPNLNFIFQGIFNLSPKTNNALYKFYANVGYADLQALNLDTRGSTSKLSFTVSSNFMKIGRGDILGDIDIRDLTMENDAGRRYIGDISVGSHSNNDIHRIQVESDFLDAGYVGSRNITGILADLQTITTRRELPSLYSRNSVDEGHADSHYDLNIDFHDTRDLLSFLKPGLYIADSSRLEIGIQKGGELRGELHSPRLAVKKNYVKGVSLNFDNLNESLNATVMGDELKLGPLLLKDAAFTAFGQHDDFFLSFHYDSMRGEDNLGEIYLSGNIFRDESDTLVLMANPLSSYMQFEGEQWEISESNITVRSRQARFKDFMLYNGNQSITLEGGIALNRQDTLSVGINDVKIGILNYFTNNNYDIDGRLSGRAIVTSPAKDRLRALMNIGCDSLRVAGEEAGSMKLAAVWDNPSGKTNVYLRNIVDGHDALNAKGTYFIDEKNLDMTANLDKMNLAVAAPFVSRFVKDIHGSISGEVGATGPLDSLSLYGNGTRIDQARFTVGYTGVAYTLDGPFSIDNSGVMFDGVTIRDDKGGRGLLGGGISFNHTRDMRLDAKLELTNLEIVNTKQGEGNFYGNVFARGNVYVAGPPEALVVEADLSTAKSGELHVQLGGGASAAESDLLTFTSHESVKIDPYQAMLDSMEEEDLEQKKSSRGDFLARCRINITPEFTAFVELDNNGDNVLSARGSGSITADIRPAKDLFEIGGDYNITGGKYHFAIPGIVRKDFNINNGSSIKFAGNLPESELDVSATYTLRTSLNRLLADSSSVATRRTVECGINIYDKLLSPKLRFSIDVPDLDPSTKAQVDAAINTEDKVQKQFLALLITGSFIASEQSGVTDNSNMLYSNVSEIMSRQLSNILYKLDIPVDLGVGYQQNQQGTDFYDVSVSTELFDNRVVVYGSVGNRQYSGNTEGDMVGDLDIDVKLDKAGSVRLNMFSHSADEYSNYLDDSQRNGAGITYQKEFSSWKEFFRSIFTSKKKRAEKARQQAAEPKKKTTIEIKGNERQAIPDTLSNR